MRTYTVTDEKTLTQIAKRVYGDGALQVLIFRANQSQLRSEDPDTVFPGDTLVIPDIPVASTVTGKDREDLTIVIEDIELAFESARIIRTMDTGADGWKCKIAWEPGQNSDIDRITRPFAYPAAAAYIGNQRLVNGLLYTVEPELNDGGSVKTLTGFSFTADAIDSTIKAPYEYSNVTLEQLARKLVEPVGIKVIVDTDTGGQFDEVKATETDTIFSFISRLAAQRGVLVSSTPDGNMILQRADTEGDIIATLTEEQHFVSEWVAKYDGRKRFNVYKAVASDAGASLDWLSDGEPKTSVAKDVGVPRSRFLTFKSNDATRGNIITAAEWKRSRQIVDALTIRLPVSGWYAPNGELWRENRRLTVASPTLGFPSGAAFITRSVEYVLDNKGLTSVLSIVPPEAYSGKEFGDIWR